MTTKVDPFKICAHNHPEMIQEDRIGLRILRMRLTEEFGKPRGRIQMQQVNATMEVKLPKVCTALDYLVEVHYLMPQEYKLWSISAILRNT